MSPWFASGLLTLAWSFGSVSPSDVAVDDSGVIWVLSAGEPVLTRYHSDGSSERIVMDTGGLPAGLAVSPTGMWAVSFPARNEILVFDRNDVLLYTETAENPGDLVFQGLDLLVVDTAAGTLGPPGGAPVARDCAGRSTRISRGPGGDMLLSGRNGVLQLRTGASPTVIVSEGSGCYTEEGVLLLSGGYLFMYRGDTLATGLSAPMLASSPGGGPVALWGADGVTVLE